MVEEKDEIFQEGVKLDDKTDEQLNNLKDLENEEDDTTPAGSSPEKKDDKVAPSGENDDNIPFHKHPRWKEMVAQRDKALELAESLEGRLNKLENTAGNKEQVPSRPEWFTKLYGADEQADEAWKLYYQNEVELERQREERFYNRFKQEQESSQQKLSKAEQEARDYIENSIQELKDEGNQFDRKELETIMKKYTPTDENNNLDFRKGLDILLAIKKGSNTADKNIARKQVASSTTSPSKPAGKETPYGTTFNLRNKSFSSLASED